MQAIAAVDICLWNALGLYLHQPLWRLLGGCRDRLPVIAIGGYYCEGKGEQELREELKTYQRAGLAGVKMKVGRLAPRDDADRVRLAREVVGPEFIIACDANQAWTVTKAIEFCRAVQDLDVRWLEEPVIWYEQLEGLPLVRQRGGLPVTAGQGEISRWGCRDLIRAGAVDILNVDATIAGGIMASCYGISMAHHEEPQISIHLLASVPNGLYVETFGDPERDPMWFELPVSRPRVRDGCMEVPEEPGIGIALNDDVIERYSATSAKIETIPNAVS
jgi:D-arabinonate dehydratase